VLPGIRPVYRPTRQYGASQLFPAPIKCAIMPGKTCTDPQITLQPGFALPGNAGTAFAAITWTNEPGGINQFPHHYV